MPFATIHVMLCQLKLHHMALVGTQAIIMLRNHLWTVNLGTDGLAGPPLQSSQCARPVYTLKKIFQYGYSIAKSWTEKDKDFGIWNQDKHGHVTGW